MQPLTVAELHAGALEGHLVALGDGKRLQVVLLSRPADGKQRPAERAGLEQPGGQLAFGGGEGSLDEFAGLGQTARSSAGLREVDQPEHGLAIV